MKKKIQDYMGAVANGYIILILAVLPLYMRDGFNMIGDTKYIFFMKYSLLAFILSAAGAMGLFFKAAEIKYLHKCQCNNQCNCRHNKWSVPDSFAAAYGICTLLSFCFSNYKEGALFGFPDWHLGLITQLLFVWIYFFISRYYGGEKYIWVPVWLAAFTVLLIGVLNRYCIDPLGNFADIGLWDWNRLNLLSTIGNINWYCGYVCLVLPGMLYFFWGGSTLYLRVFGGIGSFVGFLTLFTQGSSSGYIGTMAVLLVMLLFSFSNISMLRRFVQVLLLAALVPVLIMNTLSVVPGLELPQDGVSYEVIFRKDWYGAVFLLAACLLICIWWERFSKKKESLQYVKRIVLVCFSAVLLVGVIIFILCQISDDFWILCGSPSILRIDNMWGNGRGALWKLSLQCFREGNWSQKILGAGPDCFAHVIYDSFDVDKEIFLTGQWQGAIFANAHNEWLNMLVNGGIAGAGAYLGIFISAAVRFAHKSEKVPILIMGVMMITGYASNNFFSFQQVVSTPIMFAMLGIMESYCRRVTASEKNKKQNIIEEFMAEKTENFT